MKFCEPEGGTRKKFSPRTAVSPATVPRTSPVVTTTQIRVLLHKRPYIRATY